MNTFEFEALKAELARNILNSKDPEVIERALAAMREAGVEPLVRPIRGGTDGSRLSYMGLPCPNLFTGGMNFHGKFEYCSLTTMGRAMQVILNLARLWAE